MTGFYWFGRTDPDRLALVDADERPHSYGELYSAANRYANGLRQRGSTAGDTLAVIAPNCVEVAQLYAAAIQTGLYFVAANWHLTAGELRYILENSGARVVVAHERFGALAAEAVEGLIEPEMRFAVGAIDGFTPLVELGRGPGVTDAPPPGRQAGQAMFYTSGTTGRPKGVRKRLGSVAPDALGLVAGIGTALPAEPAPPGWVVLGGGPLYHAAPLAYLAMALDSGATIVLMDRWTPERFLDLVARYRVTQAGMVPTMFHRLLALPDDVRKAADVSSLQVVMTAGAPCSPDVKRRMIEWFGPIVNESYSSTEGAGTMITAAEWLERPGSVGRPSAGVTLRILDDDGHECPAGTPGRVFVSQTLWRFEYLGDPDKTRANRVGDLFTVGDIGYVDEDGYLFLCDRVADTIIRGGVNIYPAEVEAALLEHPAVADVAVIGAPDDEWGEHVRAVVELRSPATADELVEHCRRRLAHYKCPAAVDFVDSLGRDPNGKVRKQPIRERYWQGRSRRI